MKITENHFWYGILTLIIISFLLINLNVTLTTPIVFGDEGFYASRGEWILNHLEIPKYYHIQSHSEAYRAFFLRPPLYIFLVSSMFTGGEIFVKALNPIIGVLGCLVVFFLGKRFYSLKVGVLSALFLSIIPSFITYSVLLYVEVFAVLLSSLSVLFIYRGFKEKRNLFFVLAGILAGFAAITDIGSIALPVVFLLFFLLYKKKWLKTFLLLLVAFLITISPVYIIHNYLLLGNPGIPLTENYFPSQEILKKLPNLSVGKMLSPTEVGQGTGATILNMGLLNYIQFAYALTPFIFAIIGLSYLIMRRNKKDWTVLTWFFILGGILFYASRGTTAESAARNMLYITAPFAIMAGLSSERIYKFLKSYGENTGKIIAILFVFMLVLFGVFSIHTKAESLRPIKEFSPAFFKGCDWIRRNTPEGSLLLTLWQHRAEYACKRDTIYASDPGGNEILLSGNDTSYEIMKTHGVDYIYIQKFSIKPGREKESYPWVFVKYIKNSDHFEKVYEYPDNCMSTNEQDCVVVYKVL